MSHRYPSTTRHPSLVCSLTSKRRTFSYCDVRVSLASDRSMATIDHKFERLRQFLGPEYRDPEPEIEDQVVMKVIRSRNLARHSTSTPELTDQELGDACQELSEMMDDGYRRWQNGEIHPVFADTEWVLAPPQYLEPKDRLWAAAVIAEATRRYGAGT
jgi:hypothetical protein